MQLIHSCHMGNIGSSFNCFSTGKGERQFQWESFNFKTALPIHRGRTDLTPPPKSTPLLLKLISCMTPYILPWSETMIMLTHSRIPLIVSPAKRLFIVRSTLCKASFTCMWKRDSFQGNPVLASFPGHSHLQFLITCSR